MAFLEDCIERSVGLAATCGLLAFGGGAEAIAGVVAGSASVAALLSAGLRRHGPESESVLRSIRTRVSKELQSHTAANRWDYQVEIAAADAAMERALHGCFLNRQALAASARHKDGFPAEATRLILMKLSEREPNAFGPSGSQTSRDYARLVIRTALDAAIANEEYFRNLEPHLLIETLRGIGVVEEKVEAVHSDVKAILEILSRTHPSVGFTTKIENLNMELIANERGECMLLHYPRFPYQLDRVEFSPSTGRLEFVIPGEFKRDFGIPVEPALAGHLLKNSGKILVVLVDDETLNPIEGDYFSLRILGRE